MIANRPRDSLPDALRAIAMVSVLVVNAVGYAVAPWGAPLGTRSPIDSSMAAATQGLVAALLHGKGYAMLAFVFGMSLWLAARGRARSDALQRGLVRNRRLLRLGLLHGAFVYFGDILTLYALVGRRLLPRMHMPWRMFRRHLLRALCWALLAKLVVAFSSLRWPVGQDEWGDSTLSNVDGVLQFLMLNSGVYAVSQVIAILFAGPVIYLCMVCGVAAARLRLLTHRRWRTHLQRGLWRIGPPLLVLSIAFGWGCAATNPSDAVRAWIDLLGDLIALPVAACYLIALALASAGGRACWCRSLGALGQRTLTLYVTHSLVLLVLLSGAGWALEPTSIQVVLGCLGLWLVAWVAASLSGHRRWPLEAWMGRR
jgi:uncharacterized protein